MPTPSAAANAYASLARLTDPQGLTKAAANQMDYQAATTLYTRSLGLIKTAIGKR